MENAAKAILIAGGMLITILLASLFAYLVRQMGGSASNFYKMYDDVEVAKFNQRFLNYKGEAGCLISAQDVVSITNLALNVNNEQRFPVTVKVMMVANGSYYSMNDVDTVKWLADRVCDGEYDYSYSFAWDGFAYDAKTGLIKTVYLNQHKKTK